LRYAVNMVWGTDLKRVEIESFSKSFLLFFISLGILSSLLVYLNYKNESEHFDKELLAKMQLCSYSLDCPAFQIDFVPKKNQTTYQLHKEEKEVNSLYPFKGGDDFYLKLFYSNETYHNEIHFLHKESIKYLLILLVIVLILSTVFSLYALYPLRNALLLTREFVKDILHDFNTPISTMRLNISLLQKELGDNKKLGRIERGIESILLLQENLKNYLNTTQSKEELFNLSTLIEERVHLLENSYQDLTYAIVIPKDTMILIEKKPFTRVLDNILSNASKYNKAKGSVTIIYEASQRCLTISDTGKGIKNPKRVFERFYKEHERGVGIGLHIVKKLCDELGIKIGLESVVGEGTSFKLQKLTIS